MTAVTIHQSLPELIDKMPSGNVKDMVLKFRGYIDKYVHSVMNSSQ
jgi:hypothetical protein